MYTTPTPPSPVTGEGGWGWGHPPPTRRPQRALVPSPREYTEYREYTGIPGIQVVLDSMPGSDDEGVGSGSSGSDSFVVGSGLVNRIQWRNQIELRRKHGKVVFSRVFSCFLVFSEEPCVFPHGNSNVFRKVSKVAERALLTELTILASSVKSDEWGRLNTRRGAEKSGKERKRRLFRSFSLFLGCYTRPCSAIFQSFVRNE